MRISAWSSDVCSSDLIRALLEGALSDAKAFADGDKVELVGNISANLGSVEGDAPRLSRLVAGLLDNAVRFTAPSRKSGARVLLHADGDARGIDIIVSDNGPGMPEAAAAVAKGQRAGTPTGGIGLALARHQLGQTSCGERGCTNG